MLTDHYARPTRAVRRSSTQQRFAIALIVALLVLAVTACGGQSERAQDGTADTGSATGRSDLPATGDQATEADLVELAADAYVWGMPLVTSMRTMQAFAGLIGVNTLFWQSQLSDASTRVVVAPNRDTLYSVAVIDLRGGPLVLEVPDVVDRYWTYQFLDAWTESFAYLGTRATEGRGGQWAIVGPEWAGALPDGLERIDAPTTQLFLLGRFAGSTPDDLAAIGAISSEVRLTTLAEWTGTDAASVAPELGAPPGPPAAVVEAGATFFDELGDALVLNPPTTENQRAQLARFAPLGVGPGRHPSTEMTDPEVQRALAEGPRAGEAMLEEHLAARSESIGGWVVRTDVGTYGDDIVTRAAVSRMGWGANVAAEALYPVARTDADGQRLDGSARYVIRFEPGELPPVGPLGFWSLTLYGDDLFFAPNPLDRFAFGSNSADLVVEDDGAVEIVVSSDPADAASANWLPAPDGPFSLMLRIYLPDDSVAAGRWTPPPIERVGPTRS